MKKIQRLNAITLFLIILVSCNNIQSSLNSYDQLLDDDPKRALKALEDVPMEHLRTKEQKAKYSLLYSIALDKNFIDITTDSIISPAIKYYSKKGYPKDKLLTNYYLGRILFNAGKFAEAIIRFSEAEKYAEAICDLKYLGLIAMAKADTFNNQYNTEDELKEIHRAISFFEKSKMHSHKVIAEYRLAVALRNNNEYKMAEQTYRSAYNAALEQRDSFIISEILKSAAGFSVTKPISNPEAAMNIYMHLLESGYTNFSIRELGEMAYTFALMGHNEKADEIIGGISDSQESHYYAYMISKHRRDYNNAFKYIEQSLDYLKDLIAQTLQESAVKAQRDYQVCETLRAKSWIKNQQYIVVIMLIVTLTTITIMVLLRIIYQDRAYADSIAIRNISEQAASLINENKALKDMRNKIIIQFKSQFSTLKDICDTYTFYEGRTDFDNKMKAKIQCIIDKVRSQSGKQSELEKIIDARLNGAMTRLRNTMSAFREEDFIIISYFIAGFDSNLISRLMKISLEKVYQKKSRLYKRIITRSEQLQNDELKQIATLIRS